MLLVALACSQRVTPEEEYAEAERERPLLAIDTMGGGVPGARSMVAATTAGISNLGSIEVTVTWPASSDQPVAPTDVLFLFVRPVGVTSGPPLAVRRLAAPSFPLSARIGPSDAMIAGTELPDRVQVSARLDRDGDAMTTGPHDWEATSEPVSPGGAAEIALQPSRAP